MQPTIHRFDGLFVENRVQVFASSVDLIAHFPLRTKKQMNNNNDEKKTTKNTKSIHKFLRDTTLKLDIEKTRAMQFDRNFRIELNGNACVVWQHVHIHGTLEHTHDTKYH